MYDRLTQGDIDKMKAEIYHRKNVERPKLIEEVKTAAAKGDRSENFEYYAAKRAKRQNDSRINYLENMIRTAKIVEDTGAADEVSMDKTVEVYFPDDDETETYRIVTTIRGNSLEGLISIDSPIGKAIMHHKVGDTCTVHVNDQVSYDVVIRHIGEAVSEDNDTIKSF